MKSHPKIGGYIYVNDLLMLLILWQES